MQTDTVIFDMDGLLIDSEPLWEEAAAEVLQAFNIQLTTKQYHDTRGLRTEEWISHWFHHFKIKPGFINNAIELTIQKAIEKIDARGVAMPGVQEIFALLKQHQYKIGLATSSPMAVVHVVADKLNIRRYLQAMTSAQFLSFGKPHPEVYLACAAELQSSPVTCICFEDSFNGMIAAKAARMKCVVIPDRVMRDQLRWNAADLKLNSLADFGEAQLKGFL
ncbi:hexitol phosphatase HxpB [Agriterribacter sp.]|uniref:hexitol phosphatase HxpB n=1 Tax=Agriterribacter sp. TaxID=2821509 RepID=UPI002B5AC92E|nr:hexitol phosphatase HxpB [Agriterribacter sp.]HTN09193.1 hexitol phosphatase HxpB [Agriterribacter sp.]